MLLEAFPPRIICTSVAALSRDNEHYLFVYQDILADREDVAKSMLTTLDTATDSWGIRVERVEIKDVRLPKQLQRAMAAEAEATRQAKAKVIMSEMCWTK